MSISNLLKIFSMQFIADANCDFRELGSVHPVPLWAHAGGDPEAGGGHALYHGDLSRWDPVYGLQYLPWAGTRLQLCITLVITLLFKMKYTYM